MACSVTQAKEAYPAMTVEENLVLGAYTRKDREATKADLQKVYDFFPVLRSDESSYLVRCRW